MVGLEGILVTDYDKQVRRLSPCSVIRFLERVQGLTTVRSLDSVLFAYFQGNWIFVIALLHRIRVVSRRNLFGDRIQTVLFRNEGLQFSYPESWSCVISFE
jgi:hypothetical protein